MTWHEKGMFLWLKRFTPLTTKRYTKIVFVFRFSGVKLSEAEEFKLVAIAAAVRWGRQYIEASIGPKLDSRWANQ